MNFSYDIPVKLFSSHLLLMAIFLLSSDFNRLYRFFISNQPVAPADYSSPFVKQSWQIGQKVLKLIFIAFILFNQISNGLIMQKKYGDKMELPPLYGIYEVETFIQNGDTLPPLLTDEQRWRRLIVAKYADGAQVQFMSDQKKWYTFKPDTASPEIKPVSDEHGRIPPLTDNFAYAMPAPRPARATRNIYQRIRFMISLIKKDLNDFLLINRGFHWINERPFNR